MDDIIKTTEQYLTYLIDKEVDIKVENSRVWQDSVFIYLSNFKELTWEEVKYEIIPFIEVLNSNYNIYNNQVLCGTLRNKVTIDDIINDNIESGYRLFDMQIHIDF